MARITPTYLHAKTERISCGIFGTDRPGELYLQHSSTGWHVMRKFGAGAQALGECLTAAQAQAFLDGLSIGCILSRTESAS